MGGESVSFRSFSAVYSSGRVLAASLILGIVSAIAVWAQVAGGTISGTITDPSEKLIPQAQVSITNVATGIITTVMTHADGFFTAPNLLPGDYEITVSAKGFTDRDPQRDYPHGWGTASLRPHPARGVRSRNGGRSNDRGSCSSTGGDHLSSARCRRGLL